MTHLSSDADVSVCKTESNIKTIVGPASPGQEQVKAYIYIYIRKRVRVCVGVIVFAWVIERERGNMHISMCQRRNPFTL